MSPGALPGDIFSEIVKLYQMGDDSHLYRW